MPRLAKQTAGRPTHHAHRLNLRQRRYGDAANTVGSGLQPPCGRNERPEALKLCFKLGGAQRHAQVGYLLNVPNTQRQNLLRILRLKFAAVSNDSQL